MLGDIIRGQEKSPLVVIEDACQLQGSHLLLSFISSLAQRVDKVVIITYEKSGQYFKDHLSPSIQSKVAVMDCSQDPLGWEKGGSASIDGKFLDIVSGAVTPSTGDKTVAVVIDSLLFHILHRPTPVTCRMLHAVKNAKVKALEIVQTVCMVHADLHDDPSLGLLEHTATSVIKLSPCKSCDFQHSCCIVHQRSSGKVSKVFENFNMDDRFNVKEVSEAKSAFTMVMPDPVSQPDPAANLSFNLSLSDTEKEARSQVKLPYVKISEKSDSESQVGGKIFYQPDEADDFDEEDPDDDLDI